MSEDQVETTEAQDTGFQPQALDSILTRAEEPEEDKSEASLPKPESEGSKEPEGDKKPADDELKDEKPKDTGEKEDDPPPGSKKEDDDKSHSVPLAAMMEERDRRKQAEKRAQELEQQLQGNGEQARPSVFDNEDAFRTDIESKAVQLAESRVFKMSEHLAVDQYGEEVVQTAVNRLAELVKEDQQLAVRFRDAASPFHEAMKIVEEKEKVQAALDGSLEKEIREKVEAELKSEAEKKKAEEDEIPSSLAGVSSNGVGAGSTWQGPTKLEDALQ